MKEKQVKLPGPDHPISIQRNPARVVVSAAGRVIADMGNAVIAESVPKRTLRALPLELLWILSTPFSYLLSVNRG
jgi:uncharacterized protein (DUF427 family)